MIQESLPEFQLVIPEQHDQLYKRLLSDIAHTLLPIRRHPINPRVLKKTLARFPVKRSRHYSTLQPSSSFRAALPLICKVLAHVQATRDSAGSYAFIYVPNTQTVTVHMSAISGDTAKVSWFDPCTGEARAVGECVTTDTRFFLTPDVGPDWVLVLERVTPI